VLQRHVLAKGLALSSTIDYRLKPLIERFGNRPVAEIKTADIDDFVADLKQPRGSTVWRVDGLHCIGQLVRRSGLDRFREGGSFKNLSRDPTEQSFARSEDPAKESATSH
jgi:hypothetical protein